MDYAPIRKKFFGFTEKYYLIKQLKQHVKFNRNKQNKTTILKITEAGNDIRFDWNGTYGEFGNGGLEGAIRNVILPWKEWKLRLHVVFVVG